MCETSIATNLSNKLHNDLHSRPWLPCMQHRCSNTNAFAWQLLVSKSMRSSRVLLSVGRTQEETQLTTTWHTCSRSLLRPAPGRCHPVPAEPQNPACAPPTTQASTESRTRGCDNACTTSCTEACGTLRLAGLTQCLLTKPQNQTQPAHPRQDSTRVYTRMTSYLEERV
jgi:hypothetical protein